MLQNPLARHLPATLPGEFHFGRGLLYTTQMKDGTQYEMLRVEYITGSIPERQYTEDGGVIEDLDALGDLFVLCVRNFVPDPEETVYASGAEVPLSVLEKDGSAHVQAGDCVVTAFVEMAAPREVLEALKTVS